MKEEDETAALDILHNLEKVTISLEVLKSTHIGRTVGKIRKHDNKELATCATSLVKKWKKIVEADKQTTNATIKNTPPSKSVNLRKKSTSKTPKTPKVRGKNGATNNTNTKKKSSLSNSGSSAFDSGDGGDVREKVKTMLAEALSPKSREEEREPKVAADEIEEKLHEIYKGVTREYRARFRSLYQNFKNPRNPELKYSVLMGAWDLERLCTVPVKELASKEQQEKRQAAEKFYMAAATRGQVEDDAVTAMFLCGRCKQRKCTYFQMQTRSADEPMTTYVTCTVCNNRWKFC